MTAELEAAHERALRIAESLNLSTITIKDELRLAEAIVDVRSHIRARTGAPDWSGTTGAARARAAEIYSAVPSSSAEELARFKTRMRQRYREVVPRRMKTEDVASLIEHAEDLMDPDNFFNDLGVYIRHQGRHAADSVEAAQLAIAAAALLVLIDPDVVTSEGPQSAALVDVNLKAVADRVKMLQSRLKQ